MNEHFNLGMAIKLTVEGMSYSIREVLNKRHEELNNAIEKYVTKEKIAEEITNQIDTAIKIKLSLIIQDKLEEIVLEKIKENKEIKKAIHDSIIENKVAIAEAIYQKVIK